MMPRWGLHLAQDSGAGFFFLAHSDTHACPYARAWHRPSLAPISLLPEHLAPPFCDFV